MGKVKRARKEEETKKEENESIEDVEVEEEDTKKKKAKNTKSKEKKTSTGKKGKASSKKDETLLKKKRKRDDKKEDSKEKKNFVSKKDVKVKDIITVKKIKGILYANVHYTEKGSKAVNKGLIPTEEFTDSEPELLLKFYEKNIEFTKDDNKDESEEEDE